MAGLAWQDGATGFLQVAGRQIEYGMWGPAPGTGNEGSPEAAPTIVLLHEGLGCVALCVIFHSSWRGRPAAACSLSRALDMACLLYTSPSPRDRG